jgi:tripartite-type tricarboxylate transporter receptor subunit TctC
MFKQLVTGTVAALIAASAFAQFPDKNINYIIPFPAGGESDVAARQQGIVAKRLTGKDFIVVNKAGAGGGLVWSTINREPADGYTVAGINLPHIVLQPMEGNVQYKTDDLSSVYWFHFTPDAIVVPTESKYKTLADLIADAKANPGKLNVGGSALNSANHAAAVRFESLAGVKFTYVPFKGTQIWPQRSLASMSMLP